MLVHPAYCRWIHEPIGKRQSNDTELADAIIAIFNEHKSRYGSIRICKELKDMGWKVAHSRVSKRMRLLGLQAKATRKYKTTTDSSHNKHVTVNFLEQNFSTLFTNHRWVTDITYIPTQEGWLYLCVIIHSDKGSQYCSKQYQDIIKDNWLLSSMSRKGCCYDNAACESFFGTLKIELVHDENYKTREEAKLSIFEYIEAYYNTKREHSTINYMTPNQFEYIMENEVSNCPKLTG